MPQNRPYVVHLAHFDKERDVVEELSVVGVLIPRNDGKSVLRLEKVGRWRVVYDEHITHRAVDFSHIFDVVHSLVKSAVLPEKAVATGLGIVEDIHEWVGVLGKTCRIYDQLVVVLHSPQELSRTWANQNIDLEVFSFDFYVEDETGLGRRLERRVDQGLVKVKQQSLLAPASGTLGRQQSFFEIRHVEPQFWLFGKNLLNHSRDVPTLGNLSN